MRCIYDGAGEDDLVDIIELLLPLRTRQRMNAYLDRRHFPTVAEPGVAGTERLAERVGEILDYGLHTRLRHRYPELASSELDRWRDRELLEPSW